MRAIYTLSRTIIAKVSEAVSITKRVRTTIDLTGT